MPAEAQLTELRKSIRTTYATYYSQPGLVVRQALVKKLMDAADASVVPAEKFALLKEAADQAASLGDFKTALACDDTLCTIFKVDELDLKLAMLSGASRVKDWIDRP